MATITLTPEQVIQVVSEHGPSGVERQALQMLHEDSARLLAIADAELTRLLATSERDAEFNDARTKTPDNPQGTFSPMSTINRKNAIERAQSERDGAFIRHEWAKRQLGIS